VPTSADNPRATSVRLCVAREHALLDKTVHVYGNAVAGETERQASSADAAREPSRVGHEESPLRGVW
jgi:hypothetical protein